jgi:transcriptional regulator with XRE-family HTH domain
MKGGNVNNLKTLRGSEHQADFAARLGIPYIDGPMLSKLEKGYFLPTPWDAKIIAEKLGVKIADIWPEYPVQVRLHAETPQKRAIAFANGSDAKNYGIVTRHIPVGRQNAVTWEQIRDKTMLAERPIRERIEEARADNNIILNLNDGRGYFTVDPSDPSDLPSAILSYHRDMTIVRKICIKNAPVRRYIDRHSHEPAQLSFGICLRCGEVAGNGLYCEDCEKKIVAAGGTATTIKENL